MDVATANRADLEWLLRHDMDDRAHVLRHIDAGNYIVARDHGELIGFLRFSMFWGKIPYMEIIRILPAHRRTGIGTALFLKWEKDMLGRGLHLLMTSSEADEIEPQIWHRRNGFTEAGSIQLPGIQSAREVFFVKQIG